MKHGWNMDENVQSGDIEVVLCEVDQKRSKYLWKIFWTIFETRSNFRFTHWHWPQFVGDCATKLGRPDLSKHGDAWLMLIYLDWCCIGKLGRLGRSSTNPPCPEKWSLVHRSKDHECIRNCTVNGVYRIWRTRFFPGFTCPNHLSDLHGLMTTTLPGVLMCSFHHGQRWNWIIARRFIQRKAQESHSSHFDVQWCTHSNWHEW